LDGCLRERSLGGCPGKRWLETVEEDLDRMEVLDWKELTWD